MTVTQASSPSRDRLLFAAGVVASITTLLHIVGGGITVARPVVESSLAPEPRLVSFAVWHMTSVALGLSAVALLIISQPRFRQQGQALSILSLASSWRHRDAAELAA